MFSESVSPDCDIRQSFSVNLFTFVQHHTFAPEKMCTDAHLRPRGFSCIIGKNRAGAQGRRTGAVETQGKSKRQLQAEQTKDRLFQAAVALLAEQDFDSITIRDIVARAGVSIGTFYNYYANKMEVFYETYRVADHYFTDTVAPQLTQPTAYQRILAFFRHYARYSGELTDMRMTKLLYNPDNPFFNRDPHQGIVGVLMRQLQEGLDSGELAGEDTAEEIAEYLMIAVRGLVYHWCTCDGGYDLAAATDKFAVRLLKAYTHS